MSRARSLPGAVWLALAAGVVAACAGSPGRLDGVLEVVPRGHAEVDVGDDGSLRPRAVGHAGRVRLCITTTPALDTSQWRARLRFAGEGEPPAEATAPDARA